MLKLSNYVGISNTSKKDQPAQILGIPTNVNAELKYCGSDTNG